MPRKGPVPLDKIIHGTLNGYTRGRCRCGWCTMANRAYHGAHQTKLSGRHLRVVGPEALTERISLDLSADELEAWNEWAERTGLSRQAFVRRCVNEVIDLERALKRQDDDVLSDHGG